MAILVAYASKHGSTQGIAEHIAEQLRQLGKQADVRSMDDVADLGGYEAFVLGSAVYAFSWLKEARQWVHRHQAVLAQHPVWLFSSGPLGTSGDGAEMEPREVAELQRTLGSRDERVFFGALDYDNLAFTERMVMKAMHAPAGDFRDWPAIDSWAASIVRELG